jgi:hypothetical protein
MRIEERECVNIRMRERPTRVIRLYSQTAGKERVRIAKKKHPQPGERAVADGSNKPLTVSVEWQRMVKQLPSASWERERFLTQRQFYHSSNFKFTISSNLEFNSGLQ